MGEGEGWDLKGANGAWGLGDVPFILLGSGNLIPCLAPKIEMFESAPGDANCQRHGFW